MSNNGTGETNAKVGSSSLSKDVRGSVAKQSSRRLKLDVLQTETRNSMNPTHKDVVLVQQTLLADIDQQFLRWCREETTQLLLRELITAVKAAPVNATIDFKPALNRVLSTATTVTGISTPGSGSSPVTKASLIVSPRGNKSPYGSPGGVSIGSSSPSPNGVDRHGEARGSRTRSTPPMSPTATMLSTSGGFKVSRSPGSRSPPTSPRHFTFPGGVAIDVELPNTNTPPTSSPLSPVGTHGVGIAMNILSPSSSMAPFSTSPDTTGDEAKLESPVKERPVGTFSPSNAVSPTGLMGSPVQTRASLIAAANAEAFPVSPSFSPSSLSSGSSHKSSSPTGPGAAAFYTSPSTTPAVSPDKHFSDSKDADLSISGDRNRRISEAKEPERRRASISDGSSTMANIPTFYIPGEGGRGRGRPMAGESLEEKLPLILELFRRNNTVPAVRSPAANTNVRIPEIDVTLSWEDAHLGVPVESFAAVSKNLCGFPSFFAAPLFRRIRQQFAPAHKVTAQGELMSPPLGYTGNLAGMIPNTDGKSPTAAAGSTTARGRSAGASNTTADHRGSSRSRSRSQNRREGGDNTNSSSSSPGAVVELSVIETRAAHDSTVSRDTTGVIALPLFLAYWKAEMERYDNVDRFFRLIKKRAGRAIEPLDFMPFMEELLAFHPGLAFLESTPEFQEKYARTVIARIFYVMDLTCKKAIDARQLRKGNLIEAFHAADVEEDINQVRDYFSYEHFYVLYCKFWELDSDHDFFLTRSDLTKMTDLTSIVLDRVFAGCGRPLVSSNPGTMAFEDFVVFFMSEEDKTSEASLRYWFNVCDLDGDGVLTVADLRPFYAEQEQLMRSYGMEVIQFHDVFCQLHDLLKPKVEGRVVLQDFLHPDRCKLTGVLFSAMFNLAKFQAFEGRDPVIVKQELNMQGVSQWDRYAQAEYTRLATAEEAAATAASNGSSSPHSAYFSFDPLTSNSYTDQLITEPVAIGGSFHLEDVDDEREGPISMLNLELSSTIGRH